MCPNKSNVLLGRTAELKELKEFATSKRAGFLYVRGRRRVGKSELLKALQRSIPNAVYFFGTADSTTRGVLSDFAERWDAFTGKSRLSELKSMSWRRIFSEITDYVKVTRKSPVLIFDEIQWIAKTKSGCAGALKEAWQDWESLGVKVIVCGSSNKFFLKKTGGEEAILRGLKTRSDLWVHPFSLKQVKDFYFPRWRNEEVALTYMMLGGIPYYLNRITDVDRGFIQCVNDAVFTKDTIFLEEIDEVLRLEFNEHGLRTAKAVLGALGQDGTTQAEVQRVTGLPLTTVSRALENLCEYGLVFQKSPAHAKKLNEAGARYFMKDFYLNFYFQVLLPYQVKIKNNAARGLLFSQVFQGSDSHLFIPNFSGKAFELLVRMTLERPSEPLPGIFRALLLRDHEYDILDYWDRETQVDLLVEHRGDRISRVIECKWIGSENSEGKKYLDEVKAKKYVPPSSYSLKRYLCLSKTLTPRFLEQAAKSEVSVISLEDLF